MSGAAAEVRMQDHIEIPLDVYRGYTHQDWQKCIKDVSLNLNTLANDVYKHWNNSQPPPLSLVMALRYLHKELDAAMYWAERTQAKERGE
jgi:hypothetical protein